MTRIHRIATALLAVCAATQRTTQAQTITWFIEDSAAGVWTPWDTSSATERCAMEELQIRIEGELPSSTVFTSAGPHPTANEEGIFTLPLRVVGVDAEFEDDVILSTAIELTIEEDDSNLESNLLLGTQQAASATIECAFDTSDCVPKIIGIRLPELVGEEQTLQVNHSIVLMFADATNRPDIATLDDLLKIVAFPTYIGDDLEGTWADEKTLVLRIKQLDDGRVLPQKELMAALVQTKLLVSEKTQLAATVRIRGEVRVRVEPTGRFQLQLLLPDPVSSPIFTIRSCYQRNLVTVLSDQTLQSHQRIASNTALPVPKLSIDGVMTHSGAEAFTLRHSQIAMEDPGSWSLNFWLFTHQQPTGHFRTLIFNGDGTGEHRTPSAWFRPHDNRLVLRVSTVDNMDVGLDSSRELPTDQWVNIGFTFRNCSTASDANATVRADCHAPSSTKPWFYSMKLLVNGQVDQEALLFSPALPNKGPLHLAKGPWTDGMAGFTSQLRVYSAPIDDAAHRQLFRLGQQQLHRNMLDPAACDEVCRPSSTALPPSQQIAYWMQCHSSVSESVLHPTARALYEEADRLLAACDTRAWDLLVEAAELEDPRAMHTVGTAMLYGRLEFPRACSKSKLDFIRVEMDTDEATRLLLAALQAKEWSSARSLALLATVTSHSPPTNATLHQHQLGLYHIAAAAGRKEAYAILGRLYSTSNRLVAAYHYAHAASDASIAYHARGKQPLHEMNRLYDGLHSEEELRKGQRGDDDELIQYQKMRADKDHDVDAMFNMGDMYYWGARGLERDHEQAYRYFHSAARQGHTGAQSAVAGMLLKGEGTAQDNATAIDWYTQAARKNHTRALNGLGFMHFYGSGGVSENKSLALEFFERAAANQEDGDSVFNAGYCYAFGLGTKHNLTRAMAYYATAARRFGHFDAIYELGKLYWTGHDSEDGGDDGNSVEPDSQRAIEYLKAASEAGAWGASVRTGFELFLAGQFERAAVVYHEASEYGYAVATSNLAYLYDQKLLRYGEVTTEKRALVYLQRARDKEVLVRIGDFHFYGWAALQPSAVEALRWYTRASAAGVEAGAYNVGHMHEYGLGVPVNYERAARCYRRVLELAPAGAVDRYVAGQLALVRLRVRSYAQGYGLGYTATLGNESVAAVTLATVLAVVCVAWWLRHQQLQHQSQHQNQQRGTRSE